MPRALRVRDMIVDKYKVEVDLVASSGGVFEITVNNVLMFSKKKEGRFPADSDLMKLGKKIN